MSLTPCASRHCRKRGTHGASIAAWTVGRLTPLRPLSPVFDPGSPTRAYRRRRLLSHNNRGNERLRSEPDVGAHQTPLPQSSEHRGTAATYPRGLAPTGTVGPPVDRGGSCPDWPPSITAALCRARAANKPKTCSAVVAGIHRGAWNGSRAFQISQSRSGFEHQCYAYTHARRQHQLSYGPAQIVIRRMSSQAYSFFICRA